MRTAIITELKTISEFGNRVYQAFKAPSNTLTPYCTVKMLEDTKSVNNMLGAFLGFQVFIYNAPDSFVTLDALVKKVKTALNTTLSTDESPARFFTPEYQMTQADFFDEIKNLDMKRVDFQIPQYRI